MGVKGSDSLIGPVQANDEPVKWLFLSYGLATPIESG